MKEATLLRTSVRFGLYEDIAREYYNPVQHPTCESLRELSLAFLQSRLCQGLPEIGFLLEVGAGRSILAKIAESVGALSRVILVDNSPGMLAYSSEWAPNGARLRMASVDSTGLAAGSVSLVVASLGDPYNERRFWDEVARLLSPGGRCLFTTPAFEWSSRFRTEGELNFAEFVRLDGMRLFLPSHIFDELSQVAMIQATGLRVEQSHALGIEMLEGPPAPKLLCVGSGLPVLRAYEIRNPA